MHILSWVGAAKIRSPHIITLALAVFAAVNLFGIPRAIRLLAPDGYRTTSLSYAKTLLTTFDGYDSWGPMEIALDHIRTAPAEPLYQAVFFKQKVKFQYPPSSLLTTELVERLFGRGSASRILNRVSWICVLILAVIVPATYVVALRKFSPALASNLSTLDIVLQAAVLSALTIDFYPITRGFFMGQVQTWLTCLFAGSVLLWISGYEGGAGILNSCSVSGSMR